MFNKIKIRLKNKDNKTLLENFLSLSFLQIAGYVFPIVTLPYLARVIGVEGFGKIAFATAVITFIQTVVDWGFNFTATRDLAKNRDNKEIVSRILSNVIWAKGILCILCFTIVLLLIELVPVFNNMALILMITFLLVPGSIFFPEWFFQGIERMKYITILALISKALFTIAVFIFIKDKNDYYLQPLFIFCGYFLSGVISFYIIIVRWKIKIYRPELKSIINALKGSFDVFINNLMPNLYNSLSSILLGFFFGPMANGILDAGSRFVSIVQQFMNVLSRTCFPFLSRKIDKHKTYALVSIIISLIFSFILFIFAPIIIKIFYSTQFTDAIITLRILSVSTFFLTLCNVYGTGYLLIIGKEQQLRNISIISSLIGFAVAVPLTYYYSYIGAALTITITRGLLGTLSMLTSGRYLKQKKGTSHSILS